MAIEIYNNGELVQTIPRVLSASLCDKLDGTLTFDFSALTKNTQPILPGMVAKHNNQYYNIVRVKRGFTSGMESNTVSCEHISYLLNNSEYNLVTFVFEGTPTAGLTELLTGTPFTVGVVEPSAMIECAFTEQSPLNRRSVLMRFADATGGEPEYDGYAINIRAHRGSTVRKMLMDGKNVTSLSATYDSRKDTQAYEVNLYKLVSLAVGDEVNITYHPLSISVDTRIVGLTYNPFNRYSIHMEVGNYIPNLLAANSERLEGISQEFRAANGRLESKITSAEGEISLLQQNVSGISTRILDAEGNVSTLSQTVNGFDVRITSAEGVVASVGITLDGFNTRLEGAEGNITTIMQNADSIATRVGNAENNISTVEQTANKIDWIVASGTSSSNFTLSSRVIDKLCSGLAASIHDNLIRESRMIDDAGENSPLKKERNEINAEYEALQKEHQELTTKIALCSAKKVQIRGFLELLKKQKKALVEFDPLVWQAAVHYMEINKDCTVKFVFRDGTELPWMIDSGVKAYKKRKTAES